jgi:hypothetical protein
MIALRLAHLALEYPATELSSDLAVPCSEKDLRPSRATNPTPRCSPPPIDIDPLSECALPPNPFDTVENELRTCAFG